MFWKGLLLLFIVFLLVLFIYKTFFAKRAIDHVNSGQKSKDVSFKKKEYAEAVKKIRKKRQTNLIDINIIHRIMDDPAIYVGNTFMNGGFNLLQVEIGPFVDVYKKAIDTQRTASIEEKRAEIFEANSTDSQNVHDHLLNQGLDEQYRALVHEISFKNNRPSENYWQALVELDDWRVNAVLSSIQGEFRQLGPEEEIFSNIWIRACQVGAQNAYIEAVKDCVDEDGIVTCSTGKITRLMTSLASIDPKYGQIPDLTAIKNEALNTAAFISQDFEDYGEEYKQAITKKMEKDYYYLDHLTLQEIITMVTNVE